MKETWRDVKGYEGLYQASNTGKIKSLRSNKVLSVTKNTRYYRVALYDKDKTRSEKLVHRLVAEAFCPKLNGYEIVNHIDNNTHNNNANNLEWTTYKGNMQHAAKQGRMKSCENIKKAIEANKGKHLSQETKNKLSRTQKGNPSINAKTVICVETGEIFNSISDASFSTGVDRSAISICVNGTAGGYHWKYVEV